jgi:hypothetical protein
MPRARSAPLLAVVASTAIGAMACDQHISLGIIGDGGAAVLWTATFEPGDITEWTQGGMGGTYTENMNDPTNPFPMAMSGMAHRGQYAGAISISTPNGVPGGPVSINYLYRDHPSPKQAFYSAWYYIPSSVMVGTYLSLSHFRVSHTNDGNDLAPAFDLNLIPINGVLRAQLYDYVMGTNTQELIPMPVQLSTWVHFEIMFLKAADKTGHITVWQDGVQIIDDPPPLTTAVTDWVQWDAGGASNDILPTPAVIYMDDAAISLARLGPGK